MALTLSDDETMLADSARGLFIRSAPVPAFRETRDSGAPLRYDPSLYRELADNGFVAPHVPEAEGGLGMDTAAAGLIAEQAGRTLLASPLLSAAMAATLIVRAGSEARKADLLPRLIAGTLVAAVALDEAPRHDPTILAATAVADRVTGTKTAVIDGVGAGLFIVPALAEGLPALFIVEPEAVTVEAIASLDSRNLARITLDGAPATRLGDGDASAAIAATLDLGRTLLAAELLGIADEAFERTVAYLKQREQFGRKIGTFQALQHRAARLYARLDLSRGLVLKALRAIDEGDAEASLLASLAKAVLTKLSRDVLVEAVQMHGGIGVTDEFDIGLFLKRQRVAGELLGDDHFHTERLAAGKFGL